MEIERALGVLSQTGHCKILEHQGYREESKMIHKGGKGGSCIQKEKDENCQQARAMEDYDMMETYFKAQGNIP